jgi:hypothetical protein
MTTHSFTEEQLEAFVKGTANSEDTEAIHAACKQNPALLEEVEWLRSTREGIVRYRAAQIKANLAQLPTPPLAPWYAASQTLWVASGIAGLAVSGYFIVSLLSEPSTPTIPSTTSVVQTAPKTEQSELTDKPEPQEETPSNPPQEEVSNTATSVPKLASKNIKPATAVETAPMPEEGLESEHAESMDPSVASGTPKVASLPRITTAKDKRYSLHYLLGEEELTLFLPKSEEPYSIQELTEDNERLLYLLYSNRYYLLEATAGKVMPLKEEKNKGKLKQLERLR